MRRRIEPEDWAADLPLDELQAAQGEEAHAIELIGELVDCYRHGEALAHDLLWHSRRQAHLDDIDFFLWEALEFAEARKLYEETETVGEFCSAWNAELGRRGTVIPSLSVSQRAKDGRRAARPAPREKNLVEKDR